MRNTTNLEELNKFYFKGTKMTTQFNSQHKDYPAYRQKCAEIDGYTDIYIDDDGILGGYKNSKLVPKQLPLYDIEKPTIEKYGQVHEMGGMLGKAVYYTLSMKFDASCSVISPFCIAFLTVSLSCRS